MPHAQLENHRKPTGKLWFYGISWDEYPLVICYIVIENGPIIVDLPIKDSGFP